MKLMSRWVTQPALRVTDDHSGWPVYAAETAYVLTNTVEAAARGAGPHRLATPDWCSRYGYEFLRPIVESALAGTPARPIVVEPCSSAEIAMVAARPLKARVNTGRYMCDYGVTLLFGREGSQRRVRALPGGQP